MCQEEYKEQKACRNLLAFKISNYPKGSWIIGGSMGDLNIILRAHRKIEAICRGSSVFLDFIEAKNFGHSSL
jgi:hypothetical protein